MLELIQQFGSQPPWVIAWQLFLNGGWVLFVIITIIALIIGWLNYRQNNWLAQQKFILLAIDIPEVHVQTPKVVEQVFAAMWGSYTTRTKYEKWWEGKFQLAYSLEIVSIEGYVQFLVHTPEQYRDMVEAAIFAQYPDSDIVEVQDYVDSVPQTFPAEGWDLWGTEFKLQKSDVYPIKTYPFFEHSIKLLFADPIAGVLEILSKMGPGEQVWVQWVITPESDSWQDKSHREVKKLMGGNSGAKTSFLGRLFGPLINQLMDILRQGSGIGAEDFGSRKTEESKSKMGDMSPGERGALQAIEEKASKIAYKTKMRMVYVGLKENFNKGRGAAGVVGSFRTYSALNLNSFKPNTKIMTTAAYFRVRQRIINRQNRLLRAFRKRSQILGGGRGFMLNIEELATIYHFPNEEIRSPQLKRAAARSVEPPIGLPVESVFGAIEQPPKVTIEETPVSVTQEVESEQAVKPKVTLDKEIEKETAPAVLEKKPVVRRAEYSSQQDGPASNSSRLGGPPDNLPIG